MLAQQVTCRRSRGGLEERQSADYGTCCRDVSESDLAMVERATEG
jgi:hypothetical protein